MPWATALAVEEHDTPTLRSRSAHGGPDRPRTGRHRGGGTWWQPARPIPGSGRHQRFRHHRRRGRGDRGCRRDGRCRSPDVVGRPAARIERRRHDLGPDPLHDVVRVVAHRPGGGRDRCGRDQDRHRRSRRRRGAMGRARHGLHPAGSNGAGVVGDLRRAKRLVRERLDRRLRRRGGPRPDRDVARRSALAVSRSGAAVGRGDQRLPRRHVRGLVEDRPPDRVRTRRGSPREYLRGMDHRSRCHGGPRHR